MIGAPLFVRAMGQAFRRMPLAVRTMHEPGPRRVAIGRSDVWRGTGLLARLIAVLTRLPTSGRDQLLEVCFEPVRGSERWIRRFGTGAFDTMLQDRPDGLIVERFRGLTLVMRPEGSADGLNLELVETRFLGVRLPRALAPRLTARASAPECLYRFDIAIAFPIVGPVLRYAGWLAPPTPVAEPRLLVLYDRLCRLCSNSVSFVIRRDPQMRVQFASVQSAYGRALLQRFGLPSGEVRSFVVIDERGAIERSDAVIRLLAALRWPWRWLAPLLRCVPRAWRDALYDVVARHRYRLFGRRRACLVPGPELAPRFRDQGP